MLPYLLLTIIQNGVISLKYNHAIKPSLRKEIAAMVVHNVSPSSITSSSSSYRYSRKPYKIRQRTHNDMTINASMMRIILKLFHVIQHNINQIQVAIQHQTKISWHIIGQVGSQHEIRKGLPFSFGKRSQINYNSMYTTNKQLRSWGKFRRIISFNVFIPVVWLEVQNFYALWW